MREIRQLGKTDFRKVAVRAAVDTGQESIVQQQFRDECDVNVIVRRFGGVPPVQNEGGVYADFTGISDYETALERVRRAQEDFMKLDPKVRERYDNDPARFLNAAAAMSEGELDELSRAAAPVAPVPTPVDPAGGPLPPAVPPSAPPSDSTGSVPVNGPA